MSRLGPLLDVFAFSVSEAMWDVRKFFIYLWLTNRRWNIALYTFEVTNLRFVRVRCLTNLRFVSHSKKVSDLWSLIIGKIIIWFFSTSKLIYYYFFTSRLSRGNLPRTKKLVLRSDFLLEMLSAVILSKRSYPAMPLLRQLVDQRFIIPGPLVQRNGSLNFIYTRKR